MIMNGYNYIIRILKGESPSDVISSMPKEDYERVKGLVDNLKDTNLPRQQRRAMERKFKSVRRHDCA